MGVRTLTLGGGDITQPATAPCASSLTHPSCHWPHAPREPLAWTPTQMGDGRVTGVAGRDVPYRRNLQGPRGPVITIPFDYTYCRFKTGLRALGKMCA